MSLRYTQITAIIAAAFFAFPAFGQEANIQNVEPTHVKVLDDSKGGDRVLSSLGIGMATLDVASRASVRLSPDYHIAAGDTLSVVVTGKVDLRYGELNSVASKSGTQLSPSHPPLTAYEVLPDGTVNLPLIGCIRAVGITVSDLRNEVTRRLSEYYKSFKVDIAVSKPGTIKVGITGQVQNPGPQALPSTATVLEAILRAEILPTGSTRQIKLIRGKETRVIDVYEIVMRGDVESNVTLEPGDELFVPSVSKWVRVTGDISRPGRFEMCSQPSYGNFRLKDLLELAQGPLPTAEVSQALIQRSEPGGGVKAIHVDIASDSGTELQPGDELIIPSMSDYQPTIRLVGEFKGEGVYQRAYGTALSKSGVYRLAKGETAGDVIIRTGGTTPQAALNQARIERYQDGKLETVPLNLDKLITHQDKSSDVVLQSGDTIVLPALVEKVYVFGQVVKPGSYSYEPDRRLLDYIGQAGGPAGRSKSSVLIVRGQSDKSQVLKVNLGKGIKGLEKDNPMIQPGDVIYMPEGIITDWRDISQLVSTVRLLTLL